MKEGNDMTWLELIRELQKCPNELLEQDVRVEWTPWDRKSLENTIPSVDFSQLSVRQDAEGPTQAQGIAIVITPNPVETDKEYTVTITRKEIRELAWQQFGRKLSDDQCDSLADYAGTDMLDEDRMAHYFDFDMQGPMIDR